MPTYLTLKQRALSLCDLTGATDEVDTWAEIGLEETVKYIAQRVPLRGNLSKATYTWGASDTKVSITDAGGFNLSDFTTPERLYVNDIPYSFYDWLTWKDLSEVPGVGSPVVFASNARATDARQEHSWSIDTEDYVWVNNVNEGDVLELYYPTEIAVYSDAGIPPIPPNFHQIVMMGAAMVIDACLKRSRLAGPTGVQLLNLPAIFSALDPQIEELELHMLSGRKRHKMKIDYSYQVKQ